jgi:hypothetical protein
MVNLFTFYLISLRFYQNAIDLIIFIRYLFKIVRVDQTNHFGLGLLSKRARSI